MKLSHKIRIGQICQASSLGSILPPYKFQIKKVDRVGFYAISKGRHGFTTSSITELKIKTKDGELNFMAKPLSIDLAGVTFKIIAPKQYVILN